MRTSSQSSRGRPNAIGRILRLAGAGLAALIVAGALGAYPTVRLAGSEGLPALALGCAIAWIAGIVGFIPGCLLMDTKAEQAAKAFLAGSVIRFLVAVLLGLPVVLADVVDKTPLLLWIGIGYMVVLLVETTLVVSLMNRAARDDEQGGTRSKP